MPRAARETVSACSKKPTRSGSAAPASGGSARCDSNEDDAMLGAMPGASVVRSTSRIVSVEAMRVIPSRCASCVATADLPTPGAPPTSTTSVRSPRRSARERR